MLLTMPILDILAQLWSQHGNVFVRSRAAPRARGWGSRLVHKGQCCCAGIMEASIAAIELRRRQQAEAAQGNVAQRREAQAAQQQQGLPSVSACIALAAHAHHIHH